MLVAAGNKGGSGLIIIYLVVFGGMYFFYLRPRSKKAKAQRLEARNYEVGDVVHTIGGQIGTVVERTDDEVVLRTPNGHDLHFIPSAIARRVNPVVPESAPSDDDVEGNK